MYLTKSSLLKIFILIKEIQNIKPRETYQLENPDYAAIFRNS